MLTQESVEFNVRSLKLYSGLGFYPSGIWKDDHPTEKLQQRKLRVCRTLSVCSALYAAFMAVRLQQAIDAGHDEDGTKGTFHVVPLHVIVLVGGFGAAVIHILLWRPSRGWLNSVLLRDLLSGLPQGHGRKSENALIRSIPVLYPWLGIALEVAKWATPTTPSYSLRSVLPALSTTTIAGHAICALWEVMLLAFWISIASYGLFLQLLFLQRCHDDLAIWLQGLRGRKSHVRAYMLSGYFGGLRKIQLRAYYFNRLCSSVVYSMKLICLSVCTVGIFFCIKLCRNHQLIGTVSGFAGGMMWYCFTVLYNGGFKLPCMIHTCQVELLQRSRMLPKRWRMVLKRQIRSLGRVEVSMGGFHALERSSTILFLDFVLSKISALMITFPGQL